MLYTAVDDVRLANAAGQGVEGALDLGNHPPLDDAVELHGIDLTRAQGAHHLAVCSPHALDVGEDDELPRMKRFGDFSSNRIGVHIERAPLGIDRHWGDDGDEAIVDQATDDLGVHLSHGADAARIDNEGE